MSVGVAVLGAGTVGREVVRAFLERPEALRSADGEPLELIGVAVRDVAKAAAGGIPAALLTDAPAHLVASPDVGVVVEVMGGEEPARTLVLGALNAGKSVVTANKHLLAHHGPALESAARRAGAALRFEAAVGGGIPVLSPLAADLASNSITRVRGIVNGTTNYILTEMAGEGGGSYADVLAAAQAAGYAEADPTADVEGHDAVNKLVILARLAFGVWLDPSAVPNRNADGPPGITGVTAEDLAAAEEAGLAIKLVAAASRAADAEPDTIAASVSCVALSQWSELAWIDGVTNCVEVDAEPLGRVSFIGPGAGGPATASAVLGDLLTLARGGGSTWAGLPEAGRGRVAELEAREAFDGPSGARYPRVDA
jgi:homoserine dehydrogenase